MISSESRFLADIQTTLFGMVLTPIQVLMHLRDICVAFAGSAAHSGSSISQHVTGMAFVISLIPGVLLACCS